MRQKKIFLILALLCTMVQGTWAQNYDVWDGVSEQKPYFYAERDQTTGFYIDIWNAAQMAYVMKHWNEAAGWNWRNGKIFPRETYFIYYEECDINLRVDLDMTAATWTAIPALKKKFDGQGHHIRIKIEGNTSNYQGLFADIYADGRVENLHVDGNIHCDNSRLVGGIAGCNRGTISNCWVSADVRSDWDGIATLSAYVGGICGENYYGNVEYCCMTGNVTNKRHYVAGIAGSNSYGTIKNCTFYGSLFNNPDYNTNGNKYVGWKYSEENCFDGFNQGQYDAAGGKNMYRHALMNPYTVTLITAGDGSATADYRSTYPDKTVTLNVTSGIVDKITITDADGNDVSLNGMNYGSSYSFAMPRRNVTAKVIFTGDWPTQGEGTESDPYIICCTEEWDRFAHNVSIGRNYSGNYIKLTEDISVTQKCGTMSDATQKYPFSGIFDGDGHTITAAITDTGNQGTALFCYINGATIKNLKVAGAITGDMHAAAIVGTSEGTGNVIEGCVATANVSGGTHIGGILGHGTTSDIAISGCVFSGTMTGGGEAKGALFGWGDNGGAKSVTDCLYVMADGQNTTNLDLVRQWDGTVSVTNCYKTNNAGSNGKYTYAYTTAPANLGDLVQDYGMLKAYENGILYNGTYYVAPATLTLADNADNSTAIGDANGYLADVTLQGRTLYKDGSWNTLCLPFNVTLAGSPLEGAVARPLTAASISGTTLNLTFGDAVTTLTAGTPYIIKWASGVNIENPVFYGVTIDKTDRSYDNGQSGDIRVRFLGTYKSTAFDSENKSILLMGGENMLFYPTNGAGIGAQRAYFKIGDDGALPARRLTSFSIDFGDEGTLTGITDRNYDNDNNFCPESAWFSLDGRKLDGKPTRAGLYINNGNIVVIKQ